MRKISICDVTLADVDELSAGQVTFRGKLELAKLLSSLAVDAIGTAPVGNAKADSLLVKSLASSVSSATLAVPVDFMDPESPARTWAALKNAARPRLVVPVPVSAVQMEYFCHRKPAAMLQTLSDCICACKALCSEVEVVARDFDRADESFLTDVMNTAVECGAGIFTLADISGETLPNEFGNKVAAFRSALPENIKLGLYCSNKLYLADACALAAVSAGADEVKTVSAGNGAVALKRFPIIMKAASFGIGAYCAVDGTKLSELTSRMQKFCEITTGKLNTVIPDSSENLELSSSDDIDAVRKAASDLGYEIGDEDMERVYEAFLRLCSSSEKRVGAKELDALVATVAFQVPATYVLDSFFINTGNSVTPSCHIRILHGEDVLENVCLGDGPIDAAFIAIEKATGRHYELDDFQIRSVTEGREALGETVVRLRENGKVYPGRGVSKDIVASSVEAYLNALNKIAWEETQK